MVMKMVGYAHFLCMGALGMGCTLVEARTTLLRVPSPQNSHRRQSQLVGRLANLDRNGP